jgi:hypothetical protein
MSTAPLAPGLQPLDRRILDALARDRGRRSDRVAQLVYGATAYRCDACGYTERVVSRRTVHKPLRWESGAPMRCLRVVAYRTDGVPAVWCIDGRRRPVLVTTPEQRREVREVLRGLERIGRAYQAGGWWRRA